ncbi:MAG: sulfotransferase [Myxococcota bacterium]
MSEAKQGYDRRDRWQPAPRPDWVARLNEEGEMLDARSIVPLDENSLLSSARENTGLSDFGDDGWIEHFRVLIQAIEEEAKLNMMGRILTRSDFVGYLEARLRIQDAYTRHPEIEEEVIHEPVMILGHGRTGTTILHEVMSTDPQYRIVKRWEAMFPCPPPEEASYETDPRIALADQRITIFDRVTPEWKAMHKFGGDLPVECAEYLYASFLSNVFAFSFQIPSYAAYLAEQEVGETIRWHQRFLKLLQWKYKKEHWLLKNPLWIDHIPEVLEYYPDAKIVLTHRDPITVSDSFVNVMGTIFWWRTDDPWGGGMLDELVMADGRATTHANLMRWMEDGTLRPGYVSNVLYQDFMDDPVKTLGQLSSDLRLPFDETSAARVRAYLDAKPKGKHGRYVYESVAPEQMTEERRRFQAYQDYFRVPNES